MHGGKVKRNMYRVVADHRRRQMKDDEDCDDCFVHGGDITRKLMCTG